MWARATEQRRRSSGGRKEQGLRPSVGRSELGHPERPIQEHEALPFYWEGFTWVPVGVVWAQPSSVGRSSARTHTPTTSVSPSFSLGLGCTGCPNMLEFQINNGKMFRVTMSQLLHGTHLPKKKKKSYSLFKLALFNLICTRWHPYPGSTLQIPLPTIPKQGNDHLSPDGH